MFVGEAKYFIGSKLIHFTNKADYDAAEYAEYVTKVDAERAALGLPVERVTPSSD